MNTPPLAAECQATWILFVDWLNNLTRLQAAKGSPKSLLSAVLG